MTVGGELLFAHRKVAVGAANGEGGETSGSPRAAPPAGAGRADFETRDVYGYYVWVDVQPWKQWLFGLRYDWTEIPEWPGPRVGPRALSGVDAVRVPPVSSGLQVHEPLGLRRRGPTP